MIKFDIVTHLHCDFEAGPLSEDSKCWVINLIPKLNPISCLKTQPTFLLNNIYKIFRNDSVCDVLENSPESIGK